VQNKYPNPLFNPEYYFPGTGIIRSLYISHDISIPPEALTDTYTNLINYTFNQNIHDIYLIDSTIFFHLNSSISYYNSVNLLATTFFRNKTLSNFGYVPSDIIYGPVLITGTLDTKKSIDNPYVYSVPYPIVEEILQSYDILQTTQTIQSNN